MHICVIILFIIFGYLISICTCTSIYIHIDICVISLRFIGVSSFRSYDSSPLSHDSNKAVAGHMRTQLNISDGSGIILNLNKYCVTNECFISYYLYLLWFDQIFLLVNHASRRIVKHKAISPYLKRGWCWRVGEGFSYNFFFYCL